MTICKAIVTMLTGLFLSTALAASSGGGAERLAQFVADIQTFSAHFEQSVLDPQGNLLEQAEGEFQLARPGKFRWDYQKPYPQQIVADGERIWFYDVDLEQVTVKSQQEALADTPATLLSGRIVPEEKYHIRNLPSDDGLLWVELTPKEADSNFQAVTLVFDDDSLKQMMMRDSFDQLTRLTFSQVRKNPDFDKQIFNFTPPAGVDVVGDGEE